jgi:hypothetical protein
MVEGKFISTELGAEWRIGRVGWASAGWEVIFQWFYRWKGMGLFGGKIG